MELSSEILLVGAGGAALAALVAAALRRRARRIAESLAYLKGVRYVLSDAPDAAIGELTRAVELNPQTSSQSIETYFALGKLFRRKGDLERAIRLHQNILLRPGLPPEIKREAQLELAVDLQRAGLHSRAAEAFEKFLAEAPGHPEALRALREVKEEARDLEGAAEVQVRVVKAGLGGEGVLAHLLAAAARAALAAGDAPHARALAEGALKAHPPSTDAAVALAEVHLAAGESAPAAERLLAALAGAPALALELEPLLARALPGPQALTAALAAHLAQGADEPPLRVALARAHSRQGARVQAARELREALLRSPGYVPARRDLGALLLDGPLEGELLPAFEELLRSVSQPELEYRCRDCAHAQAEPAWRCPRCRAWDTLDRASRASPAEPGARPNSGKIG